MHSATIQHFEESGKPDSFTLSLLVARPDLNNYSVSHLTELEQIWRGRKHKDLPSNLTVRTDMPGKGFKYNWEDERTQKETFVLLATLSCDIHQFIVIWTHVKALSSPWRRLKSHYLTTHDILVYFQPLLSHSGVCSLLCPLFKTGLLQLPFGRSSQVHHYSPTTNPECFFPLHISFYNPWCAGWSIPDFSQGLPVSCCCFHFKHHWGTVLSCDDRRCRAASTCWCSPDCVHGCACLVHSVGYCDISGFLDCAYPD